MLAKEIAWTVIAFFLVYTGFYLIRDFLFIVAWVAGMIGRRRAR